MILTIQKSSVFINFIFTSVLIITTLFPVQARAESDLLSFLGGIVGGVAAKTVTDSMTGAPTNAACLPTLDYTRPCKTPPDIKHPRWGGLVCPCINTTVFTTTGKCVAPLTCKAVSTAGPSGFGTDIMKQVLGSLMQKLMSGGEKGGSGSGSGSTPASTPTSGTTGCAQYYNVTTPTPQDPCAIYVQPVSDSIGTTGSNSSAVSDYLNQTDTGTTDTNTSINTNTNTNQLTVQVSTVTTTTDEPTSTVRVIVPQGAIGGLTSGVSGDVKTLGNSGTILAGSVDANNNSVTAGFYGGESFNGQPQGAISGLCQNRPWASNFISYVLPATFFDSLCTLRGYQVGQPVKTPAPVVTVTQTKAAPVTQTQTTNTVLSNVAPKVSIWAAPATVPLGSRTSIFWNSQGVTNCIETSPDGAFAQSSLSGGASTVAITGSTVFSISCITPDGSHVTDSVTVELTI